MCQVAIVGYGGGKEQVPGHDLTYQAGTGVLNPPLMPRVLVADVAGAERAATEAAALLLASARGFGSGYAQVSLAQVAEDFAESFRRGVTTPGGVLGGGHPGYKIYRKHSANPLGAILPGQSDLLWRFQSGEARMRR